MKRKVILRADGNSQIGLGHIYRLLALAEILKDDFDCFFAVDKPDLFTRQQIESVCAGIIILSAGQQYSFPDTNKLAQELPFDLEQHLKGDEIVVTDGYLFGKNYQLAVKSTGAKLVCIDDLAETEFYADVIINHAPGVDHLKYKTQPYTKIFTGLEYSIIRAPFFNSLPEKNEVLQNVFVSLGGADYFQFTRKIIEFLLPYKQFDELNILVSSSFSKELILYLQEIAKDEARIKLHHNINANQLVDLLDNCTHAFVAASTVLIESYARGLKCFAGYYTKNQQFIYNGFNNLKYIFGLGDFNDLSSSTIQAAIGSSHQIKILDQPIDSKKNLNKLFSSI